VWKHEQSDGQNQRHRGGENEQRPFIHLLCGAGELAPPTSKPPGLRRTRTGSSQTLRFINNMTNFESIFALDKRGGTKHASAIR
jgi:hypothetical protein